MRYAVGSRPSGDRCAHSKISERTVERMREARRRGMTNVELARTYGLHEDSVGRLINGRGRIADRHPDTDAETSLT